MPLQEMTPLTIEGEQLWCYQLTYPILLHQQSASKSIDPWTVGNCGDWLVMDKVMQIVIMTPEGYEELISGKPAKNTSNN